MTDKHPDVQRVRSMTPTPTRRTRFGWYAITGYGRCYDCTGEVEHEIPMFCATHYKQRQEGIVTEITRQELDERIAQLERRFELYEHSARLQELLALPDMNRVRSQLDQMKAEALEP